VPHLGQVFSRDPLKLELAWCRGKRDLTSKFIEVAHRYELYVHQVQQGVAFSSELGRLVKRRHRVIAEGNRAENFTEYRRHLSGHVPSSLDFLTAQAAGHARSLAEITGLASSDRHH